MQHQQWCAEKADLQRCQQELQAALQQACAESRWFEQKALKAVAESFQAKKELELLVQSGVAAPAGPSGRLPEEDVHHIARTLVDMGQTLSDLEESSVAIFGRLLEREAQREIVVRRKEEQLRKISQEMYQVAQDSAATINHLEDAIVARDMKIELLSVGKKNLEKNLCLQDDLVAREKKLVSGTPLKRAVE